MRSVPGKGLDITGIAILRVSDETHTSYDLRRRVLGHLLRESNKNLFSLDLSDVPLSLEDWSGITRAASGRASWPAEPSRP